MKAAILLYTYAGSSYRGAKCAMEVFNFVFPFLGLDIPSHVTIKDWVEKAGLDVLCGKKETLDDYAVIVDESITIAEHKILLTAAVPARHEGQPLTFADAEIVDIDVAGSHKGGDVKEAMDRTTKGLGKAPEYAVTDNGRNLVKGLSDADIDNHRDISHTFGTYLKAIYGADEEFHTLTKAIGDARHFALTYVDYLMPNNMRAIARWMNVFEWARWAKDMLEAEHKLGPKERKMYSFLWEHGALVEELNEVMTCFRNILENCKSRGLSRKSARECTSIINQELMGRGDRLTRLGEMMLGYFATEVSLLKNKDEVHHISSDLIESLFGYFKERMSPNRMYGVTGFILVLPLHSRLSTLESARTFDFKAALEHNSIADVKAWERKTLPENLAAKRGRILRRAS